MGDTELLNSFRAKAGYMKSWKPASQPSNRDRLELYALHKQAVSGDAPNSIPPTASAPEKAKFQAWRAKLGLSQQESMRLYIQESDRQIRVYGTTAERSESSASLKQSPEGEDAPPMAPRGLAAIPLLCAAASESRPAYLRRLANTPLENAWWSRQEPLCTAPGTLWSFPEAALIGIAILVEKLSLSLFRGDSPIPQRIPQSFLWPLHNSILSAWMGVIIVYTIMGAGLEFAQTLVWGARRTGNSLVSIWKDKVKLSADSVLAMCDSRQPISARLVGLSLLPYTTVVDIVAKVGLLTGGSPLVSSTCYIIVMYMLTWWYWIGVLPWLLSLLLGGALFSGSCFAIIETAGM